jgi:hypothetical protein
VQPLVGGLELVLSLNRVVAKNCCCHHYSAGVELVLVQSNIGVVNKIRVVLSLVLGERQLDPVYLQVLE